MLTLFLCIASFFKMRVRVAVVFCFLTATKAERKTGRWGSARGREESNAEGPPARTCTSAPLGLGEHADGHALVRCKLPEGNWLTPPCL